MLGPERVAEADSPAAALALAAAAGGHGELAAALEGRGACRAGGSVVLARPRALQLTLLLAPADLLIGCTFAGRGCFPLWLLHVPCVPTCRTLLPRVTAVACLACLQAVFASTPPSPPAPTPATWRCPCLICCPPSQDVCFYAFFAPYTYTRHLALVARMASAHSDLIRWADPGPRGRPAGGPPQGCGAALLLGWRCRAIHRPTQLLSAASAAAGCAAPNVACPLHTALLCVCAGMRCWGSCYGLGVVVCVCAGMRCWGGLWRGGTSTCCRWGGWRAIPEL